MKSIISSILITIALAASSFSQDYDQMNHDINAKLQKAIAAGKIADVQIYSNALESLAKTRYLNNVSSINEAVVLPLIEGFRPQLETLPVVLKTLGSETVKDEIEKSDNPNLTLKTIVKWIVSSNAEAAKMAAGDLTSAIDVDRKHTQKVVQQANQKSVSIIK